MHQKKNGDEGTPLTFDDLVSVGLGCLQFNPVAFWEMDFCDLLCAVEGYTQQVERTEQMEWERVRWLAAVLLSPHGKKGQSIKPTDLVRFPWDTLQRKVTLSQQKAGEMALMNLAKKKA